MAAMTEALQLANDALVIPIAGILSSTVLICGGFLTIAGVITFIWKIGKPLAKGVTTLDEKVIPNVKYMPHLAKLDPMLTILQEVVAQVRTDSGSSLLDIIERLEQYAQENREAAAEAKEAAAAAKDAADAARMAAEEFAQINAAGIARAAEQAEVISQGLKDLEVLVGTIKEHAKDERELARTDRDLARDDRVVATAALAEIRNLAALARRSEASGARIEADQIAVADHLAQAQQRADEVPSHEPPGAAADAASQSPEDGGSEE